MDPSWEIGNLLKVDFKEYVGVGDSTSEKNRPSKLLKGALKDLMEMIIEWCGPDDNEPAYHTTEPVSINRLIEIQQNFRLPARKLALLHRMYHRANQELTKRYGAVESFLEHTADAQDLLIFLHNKKKGNQPLLQRRPYDSFLLKGRLQMITDYTEEFDNLLNINGLFREPGPMSMVPRIQHVLEGVYENQGDVNEMEVSVLVNLINGRSSARSSYIRQWIDEKNKRLKIFAIGYRQQWWHNKLKERRYRQWLKPMHNC